MCSSATTSSACSRGERRIARMMARSNALVFNWWSLYTRLALPGKHTEATTSRPMLVYGLGKKTRHSQQTTLTVTSNRPGNMACIAA